MPTHALIWACRAYAVVVAAIALMHAVGPERLAWGGLALFVPQAIWALPGLLLLPLTLVGAPRAAWMPAIALFVVAGPLMGFTWASRDPSPLPTLRLATYNVQLWQRRSFPSILNEIEAADPDVLCLQDARGIRNTRFGARLKERHVAMFGQYVVVSKFPILESTVGDISYDDETHTYLRVRLDVRGRPVTVFTAHLVTPRDALSPLRSPAFWRLAASEIRRNQAQRMQQARKVAEDARRVDGPLIIAGDLNAPPASLVTRTLTDLGLSDAFSEAGRGYGYTFGHSLFIGRSFLRLDRILVSRHFEPVSTWVGGASGSDHRPVVADLVLREQVAQ
jgi:endonuclease/exonuclease/phosphatase (EEP) superfamily protein YafD